jgi:hypothetical protein
MKSGKTKFKTLQPITILEATNLNISSSDVIVWVVGVTATTSRRAVELVRLWLTEQQSMENMDQLKNIKMNLNEWPEKLKWYEMYLSSKRRTEVS